MFYLPKTRQSVSFVKYYVLIGLFFTLSQEKGEGEVICTVIAVDRSNLEIKTSYAGLNKNTFRTTLKFPLASTSTSQYELTNTQ